MLKVFFTCLFVVFFHFCSAQQYNLTLRFYNMKNDKGNIMLAVFDSEAHFLKNFIKGEQINIKNKQAEITISLPEGAYAISAFHDENNNQKLDKNFMGIPRESYGFSNDARGFMGPPKYRNTKFILNSDKVINIKIH